MKCKITIIEDDADLRSLLHNGLRLEGYSVCTYANGDEFLLSWNKDGPSDLYVIDINLGGTTGFEICTRIKSKGETRAAIVILISANPEVQQLARDACADDYMLKPFSQRELLVKIRALVQQRPDNNVLESQA